MQKLRKYQHLQQKINQKELEFNSGSFFTRIWNEQIFFILFLFFI
ncbi:Hypothetical protein RDF_0163 [Streptococcus agalactiae]|nr:hypothetical protein A964_0176 [Streptococcus agalactiae GD201008-001]AIX03957.1 glycerophosphoryl diester phosphodiesterase family protein [Streptococcus agalactiae CNCTC 10/84]AKI94578.1 Hypothetical protein RDF_0163 [Streptococcus agalactiae]ETJ96598.1 hypothetical protein HMPREF1256_0371 [Streptococcus agalactiae BV3L5]CCW37023.1 hypothetical protein BSA_2190 [Streptococcus agalactiae 09mas018883]CCW39125.1 hypothetical protein MSA_2320 [Streptococcus agalactiae ILRI005]